MVKTSTKQKILLLMFSIILTIIIMEIGFGRFVLLTAQRSGNIITGDVISSNEKVYRILALGESTTAGLWEAWPAQLENVLSLRSTEARFFVYNEGIPAIDTLFILSNLETNLDKYQPDIVITMMGINDGNNELPVIFNDEFNEKQKILGSLEVSQWNEHKTEIYREWNYNSNYLSHEEMQAYYTDLINSNPNSTSAYYSLALSYYKVKKYNESENMFKKALNLSPNNPYLYRDLAKLYSTMGRKKEAEELLKIANEIYPMEYSIINDLINIDEKNLTKNYEKYLGIPIKIVEGITAEQKTRLHYIQLYEILKKRNITLIAMQYPTLNISKLQELFPEEYQKEIIFVGNEENFKIVNKENFKEYFTDSFASNYDQSYRYYGQFGHTSQKGSRLIAENVANVILAHLNITSN